MLEIFTKTEYNKMKKILKDNVPYSIYKEVFNTYEKNNDVMLVNTLFSYLCYLSKTEFNNFKTLMEETLNKKFIFEYNKIPLFNEKDIENKESTTTILKPKIEYENLEKSVVLDLIKLQNNKDKNKNKEKLNNKNWR